MNIFQIFSIFLAISLLYSCGRVEGCNDPLAKNYDAEADKTCCCEYYQLRFDLDHASDAMGTALVLFSPYTDASGQSFQIKSGTMLVSNATLLDSGGVGYSINDTIQLPLQGGSSFWVTDDFSAIRTGTFINNIGGFTRFGQYTGLQFLVGLQGNALQTSANELTDNTHPLSASNSNAFFDSGSSSYKFGRWEIVRAATQDTVTYVLSDTVWINLPYQVSAIDGSDTRIPIRLNYLRLFDGISFNVDDSSTVVQKIKTNLPYAFSIQ